MGSQEMRAGNAVFDARQRAAELQLRSGELLCLLAQSARLYGEIGSNCRTSIMRDAFIQQARRTIFVADCWRFQLPVTAWQRMEFLRLRQAVKRSLAKADSEGALRLSAPRN